MKYYTKLWYYTKHILAFNLLSRDTVPSRNVILYYIQGVLKKGRSHGGSMEEVKENKKSLIPFCQFRNS